VFEIQFRTAVPTLQAVVPSAIASIAPTGFAFSTSMISPTITSGPVFVPHGGGGGPTESEKVPVPPLAPGNVPSWSV
jgi:hypothetical protein